MNLYRDIIKRVLQITWRYKFLWFFGFFATALGSASDIGLLVNSIDDLTSQSTTSGTMQTLLIIKTWFQALTNIFSLPITSTIFLLAMLGFFLVMLWIVFTSIAGIMGSVAEIEKGKRLTFDGVWKIGAKYWLQVLGINLAVKIIAIIVLIAGLPILKKGVTEANSQSITLFLVYFTLVFLPIIFVSSLIAKYAMGFAVVRGRPFDQAILSALKLFKNHWLLSIEMAFVVLAGYLAAGFGYVVVAFFITLFFQIFSLMGYLVIPSVWWHIGTTVIALLTYSVILFLLGAVLSVFEYAAWTKLFLRIEEGKASSKILRLADALPKFLK